MSPNLLVLLVLTWLPIVGLGGYYMVQYVRGLLGLRTYRLNPSDLQLGIGFGVTVAAIVLTGVLSGVKIVGAGVGGFIMGAIFYLGYYIIARPLLRFVVNRAVFGVLMMPGVLRWAIRRYFYRTRSSLDWLVLRDLPLPPPGRYFWRLYSLYRRKPTQLPAAALLAALYTHDRTRLRSHAPELNTQFLQLLPGNPFGLFCANCMHFFEEDHRGKDCPRCGQQTNLYLGIERLTAAYLPAERAHYTADRAAGRITLNLAVEAAWAYPHAPLTHVVLDLSAIENPDLLLNRLLTHFHVLETHPARIHWQLTGLDALGENTRRLLAERVPGVGYF